MKHCIYYVNQCLHYIQEFKDYAFFVLFVSVGFFHKIYEAMKKGKKFSFKWLLAEAVISLFVAVSVWAICDHFLHLNKILTYVICAWAGKSSAIFSENIEELIEAAFDVAKSWLKIQSSKKEQSNE